MVLLVSAHILGAVVVVRVYVELYILYIFYICVYMCNIWWCYLSPRQAMRDLTLVVEMRN